MNVSGGEITVDLEPVCAPAPIIDTIGNDWNNVEVAPGTWENEPPAVDTPFDPYTAAHIE